MAIDAPERLMFHFPVPKARKVAAIISMLMWAFSIFSSLNSIDNFLVIFNEFNEEQSTEVGTASIQAVDDPFTRIAVMGQFNYGKLPIQNLILWRNAMKKYGNFADTALRGPFWGEDGNHTVQKLRRKYNIDIQPSPKTLNEGYFAPYLNMAAYMKKMKMSNISKQIDGVLYLHDDAVPNLKVLKSIFERTQNQAIVGTDWGRRDSRNHGTDGSYENPRDIEGRRELFCDSQHHAGNEDSGGTISSLKEDQDEWKQRVSMNHYRIYPFGRRENNKILYTDAFGNASFHSFKELDQTLKKWPGGTRDSQVCHWGQESFALDPEAWPYLDVEKYDEAFDEHTVDVAPKQKQDHFLLVPTYTQADFLYIPLNYTDIVVDLAHKLYKHGIWVECAFAMIVDQISKRVGETRLHDYPSKSLISLAVPLCTRYMFIRGKPEMVRSCEKQWERDSIHDKIPWYHRQFVECTNYTWQHPLAVYHPIKIGKNTSFWEQTMKSING